MTNGEEKSLAKILKEARETVKVSQQSLARRAGVSNKTIVQIESGGGARADAIVRLARALELDPKELLNAGGYPNPEIYLQEKNPIKEEAISLTQLYKFWKDIKVNQILYPPITAVPIAESIFRMIIRCIDDSWNGAIYSEASFKTILEDVQNLPQEAKSVEILLGLFNLPNRYGSGLCFLPFLGLRTKLDAFEFSNEGSFNKEISWENIQDPEKALNNKIKIRFITIEKEAADVFLRVSGRSSMQVETVSEYNIDRLSKYLVGIADTHPNDTIIMVADELFCLGMKQKLGTKIRGLKHQFLNLDIRPSFSYGIACNHKELSCLLLETQYHLLGNYPVVMAKRYKDYIWQMFKWHISNGGDWQNPPAIGCFHADELDMANFPSPESFIIILENLLSENIETDLNDIRSLTNKTDLTKDEIIKVLVKRENREYIND